MLDFFTLSRILPFVICFLAMQGYAQEREVSPFELQKDKLYKPFFAIQAWATYSFNETNNGKPLANQTDVHLRRLRFGGTGQPYSWLKYMIQIHADRLGENPNASTKGSFRGVQIWNAFLTAKLSKNSELIHLHAGYFWAAVSREFNTRPWDVVSLDKTRSVVYLRNFVTGKGNGIESGIGLGGLKNRDGFGFSYRVGIFVPEAFSSPAHGNPLFTGRFMFSFGDPENERYSFMLPGVNLRKKGITLSLGGSYQGSVDNQRIGADSIFFDQSLSYGGDVLINYDDLQIDGEFYLMRRNAAGLERFEGQEWHVRAAYNLHFQKTIIQPNFTLAQYEGSGSAELFRFIGEDITYDIGLNWFLNRDKLNLKLHYIIQEGEATSNTGDYVALGMNFRL